MARQSFSSRRAFSRYAGTGLSVPAIVNITRRLLDNGLIEEAGKRRGERGQPPTKYIVRPNACHAIGVNVDRDHITIVLVNFAGEVLARKETLDLVRAS